MKAWRVNELGEARDVLKLEDVAEPVAGDGQVLVRTLATPANFPDVLLCRGEYQIMPPLPFTPGGHRRLPRRTDTARRPVSYTHLTLPTICSV